MKGYRDKLIGILGILICVNLLIVGCNSAPTAGSSSDPVNSGDAEEMEPKEYDQEVISMLGPKSDMDPQIEIRVSSQAETDPRLVYTKAVLALIKQIEENPEGVECTPALKEQLLANPTVIPEIHEAHNYFVYSISQLADSNSVSCNVGYYDNGNMVVELVKFSNNDGLITISETDKLIAFLSGGAYAV